MNKDNRHTALVFSKNYFTAIVVSIIVTFASFYFAAEATLAQSVAGIVPALITLLLEILNVILALACFFSIVSKNKVIQYSWVLFYFTLLLLYMFRAGPSTIVIEHPDPAVRARVADSLGGKESIPSLLKMLNDEDKRVRFNAAVSLGRTGVKQGANVLINIIEKDGDVLFREKAAEELGWLNDPKGNDFLFNLFKSENQESREIAFTGIRRLDNSSSGKYMEFIISALSDENENIRKSAVGHFDFYYRRDGKLDQQLVEVLLPLLKDKSAAVRESVANALTGKLEQKIVEYLLPLLKDPSPGVRVQTVRALAASGNPLVIDPLISAAQDEDNWEVRDAIARWIGSEGIKDRRAIEFLLSQRKSFLNDEYGVIYWESKGSKEFWLYNWQFKTKNKFTAIEIVFVDQDGKQEILVDNKTMNNFPLEFRFCLSDPKPQGNLENPDLSVFLRYLRTEDQGRSYSIDYRHRQKLQRNKLKNVVYNKINSLEDQFNQSGEIILATYTTADDTQEFTSIIKVKYEVNHD